MSQLSPDKERKFIMKVTVKVKETKNNRAAAADVPKSINEAERIKWCLDHGILPDIKTKNAKKAASSDFIKIPGPLA